VKLHDGPVSDGRGQIKPLSRPRRAHMRAIASRKRFGRVKIAVRRCFILSDGNPILARDVLQRAFPRVSRFQYWQRWSVRRALLQAGEVIARNRYGRGKPCLWAPIEHDRCQRVARLGNETR
jgi:hypothetical protein